MYATAPTAPAYAATLQLRFIHGVRVRPTGLFWPVDKNRRIKSSLFHLPLESTMNTFSKSLSALFLAVTLVSAVGCASTPQQAGTGEYVDDTIITTKVKAAIFNEPTLKSAEINVETFKGVVQLSGFVNSQADINMAVSLARGVKGVSGVKNDMRLK
jgi:hyperosmotically inducible protein